MKRKQQLVIFLPDVIAEIPVRIIRGSHCKELVFHFNSKDEEGVYCYTEGSRNYAFIWGNQGFDNVPLEDIISIEADGSYSKFLLTGNRMKMVSYNLANVSKELPPTDFVRIHRSRIINLRHVDSMTGNKLKLGDEDLEIGRGYKKNLRDRIISIGISRHSYLRYFDDDEK